MYLSEFMIHDHHTCDDLFTDIENAVVGSNWVMASQAAHAFRGATLHHFQLEETVLFPALEDVTGQREGPTEIMRLEHAEMRQLLDELTQAVTDRDVDTINGVGDTLVILMQQHNAKEEQVLYPLIDRLLGSRAAELLDKLHAVA